MRLSEAMQLGAMLNPQGFYYMFGSGGTTCALGAAARAVGATTMMQASDVFATEWPWIFRPFQASCPDCATPLNEVLAAVMHLNDWHQWTREAIADWVATIEPREEIEATLTPVLVHQEQGV